MDELFIFTDTRILDITDGISILHRETSGKITQKVIFPPADRLPRTHYHSNGICAFTDANNHYYLCQSKHKELLPIYTIERKMPVILSNGDKPIEDVLAVRLGLL